MPCQTLDCPRTHQKIAILLFADALVLPRRGHTDGLLKNQSFGLQVLEIYCGEASFPGPSLRGYPGATTKGAKKCNCQTEKQDGSRAIDDQRACPSDRSLPPAPTFTHAKHPWREKRAEEGRPRSEKGENPRFPFSPAQSAGQESGGGGGTKSGRREGRGESFLVALGLFPWNGRRKTKEGKKARV